ncbi:Serine/threonine-protein kinase PknD [Enhygromyxa salina]|uniref:Serine/threonine-protein kinase PknD n=1 Tax=Enhygromyxa salina TaxID=215803 RepID=A0A2S9XAS6_9BACT|nr:serine/threonine-protein kinase [Enhygromyxa salina]PRP89953.1 Serine/threonine-protein kinase PknD [Enhygromyxa salina]
MPDVEGTEFEERPTIESADGKTLAWPRGQGPTVTTDIEMPAVIDFAGRYSEQGLLGEGGVGTVSLHEDRQIGRHVAVKRLLPRAGQPLEPAQARRFVQEARVQAQLEHPAVVPVYDLGVDRGGEPWFSMKRVSGVTLAEVVDRLAAGEVDESWSRRRLLTALSQVCLAVDFAHERGVLHRDLKPENVMLGDYGEVYVLDWGLAKEFGQARARPPSASQEPVLPPLASARAGVLVEGKEQKPRCGQPHASVGDTALGERATRDGARGGSAGSQATNPGVIVGTPGFMPPEQIRGLPLAPTADVYALGAILFELLTLEPLQPIDEVPAMLRSALEGVELRPSIRAPARDLPPELDAIVVRALDPDPARRYPSARALNEAIEAFLDGQRDVELRSKLARAHAREAAGLLDSGEPGGRRQAMQAIGRALALDPNDRGAMTILHRILTQPPSQRPPAVARALELSAATQRGSAARVASLAYLSILLFLPLLFWAGIRDLAAALPFFIAMLIAGAISHFGNRDGKVSERTVTAVMIVSNIGIACTTTLFGALILLPAIAAVQATAFALTFTDWRRFTAVAAAILAVVVPLALELGGVTEASYQFGPEGMLVRPRAMVLTETTAIVFLALGSFGSIVIGAVTVAKVHAALLRAEEQLHTYAWQLQQLLPDGARDEPAPSC